MYCRFKFWLKGEPLTDLNNKPVKDGLGQPVMCVGQWADPRTGNQLNSAMTALHTVRKCHGPYQEPCDACCALAKKKKYHGCDEHTGNPRLRRSGNPTQTHEFKNELKSLMNLGKKRGYKVGGSSTCLPGDYRGDVPRERYVVGLKKSHFALNRATEGLLDSHLLHN